MDDSYSHMSEHKHRPGIDPFSAAVVRRLVLSALLIASSATAIGTMAMSAMTFVAVCFLGLSFFFYALHDAFIHTKLRSLAFLLSVMCSIGAIVVMILTLAM